MWETCGLLPANVQPQPLFVPSPFLRLRTSFYSELINYRFSSYLKLLEASLKLFLTKPATVPPINCESISDFNPTMSRHRMKTVSYDDDYEDDDGYDSPDPEEQEYLEQCTKEVLGQLRSGEPSVTATRDEIQEALWHYYNDVEKSVNYLRG